MKYFVKFYEDRKKGEAMNLYGILGVPLGGIAAIAGGFIYQPILGSPGQSYGLAIAIVGCVMVVTGINSLVGGGHKKAISGHLYSDFGQKI